MAKARDRQQGRDGFGHDTTTDEVLDGIDLAGKLAVVTGGSGGLGAETARALASKGAAVVLTARDLAKGERVAEDIRKSTGNARVEVEELELASLASIRAFTDRFLTRHHALQILVNNAGVMACPFGRTADGFELQFGTNHLGHFLLTGLLAPALLRGAPARVVSLSSRGHQQSPVVFDDIGFENRPYDKWLAYGQAKTANVLLAVELERRLGDRGVHALAVHPGVIPTDLSRHMEREDFEHIRQRAGGELRLKTVESGAATSVWAATAPELEGRGALYLEDCHVAAVDDAESASEGVRSYAVDPEAAKRLWAVSEELVGRTFDL
jgi:NAD(P)-dependent dehydrogenase (short-subunit alcohol dehydrogenase family)